MQNYDCILITGTSLAAEPSRTATLYAIEIAKQNNIPVLIDIDYRPYTWESADKAAEIYNLAVSNCSAVIGNDDEFAVLAKDYQKGLSHAKMLSKKLDLIIYKRGDKGSASFYEDKEITKGIFPVKPLKPTGAGDAFMGALIGSLLQNFDIDKSIEIGSAAAAIVVTKVGCAPAMPNLEEIFEFMKFNNMTKGV